MYSVFCFDYSIQFKFIQISKNKINFAFHSSESNRSFEQSFFFTAKTFMSNEESANTSNILKTEPPNSTKKLSPAKIKRAEDRTLKFNTKVSTQSNMANAKISCGYITYAGDAATLGFRWESWNERFVLFFRQRVKKTRSKAKPRTCL